MRVDGRSEEAGESTHQYVLGLRTERICHDELDDRDRALEYVVRFLVAQQGK